MFCRSLRLASVLFTAGLLVDLAQVPARAADAGRYLNSTTDADSVVTFNEVLYQPAGGDPADEWIELHNQHAVIQDLSHWSLSGGVDFQFPPGTTIPGGGYVVVAADPVRFRNRTGFTALGPFTRRLSDSGDRLVLRNLNDRLMDEVDYRDSAPWPDGADGSGATLAKRVAASPSSPPENWRTSVEVGGTPGALNFPEPGPPAPILLFSEATAADLAGFFCELLNPRTNDVSLEGVVIQSSDGGEFRFHQGVLEAGGHRVLGTNELGFTVAPADRLFLLGAAGGPVMDAVRLSRQGRARQRGGLDDPFLRPAQPTPGSSNVFELREEIVLNEIHYHSPPTHARPGVPAETTWRGVVNWDATWRYRATGSYPGATWHHPDTDDGGWALGSGLLGNRAQISPEPLRTTLPLGFITYYFRIPFVVETTNGICGVQLRAIVDDGAVLYLNGEEIWRIRMPSGPVSHDTLGLNNGDPPVDGPFLLEATALRPGTNWLAMEVHQWNRDSSDIVAGAELSVCVAQTPAVPGTPFTDNAEQWIELFNRSSHSVDLSGWRLADEIEFEFPTATQLEAGAYLVVARDPAAVRARHPGIRVVGPWNGRLSGRGGQILLLDAVGNPADGVRYFDDTPWPRYADGGGSSLELRDPRADNARAESWGASDETGRSVWKTYSYRARAVAPVKAPDPHGFHEFRMGLLAAGEVLVDDLTVVEDPDGSRRSLIQNGGFEDARAWRLLGNHSLSRVVEDPDRAGNGVLQLVAMGARGYMNNHLETTLKAGGAVVPVVAGKTYEITFRAKWLRGTPLLHTELYYNKVARTTVLEIPPVYGTPGRRNTAWVTNQGPTLSELSHAPLVPVPGQSVTVQVRAEDPDQIAAMTLNSSVNGGAWQSRTMAPRPDAPGTFSAVLPASTADSVVQFYVSATDGLGAVSWMPAAGPASRALYRVDSRVPRAPRKGFHFILTAADGRRMDAGTNMMSDERFGATVVWDAREVFYDCGVHLHGSMFSRANLDSTPYSVRFPVDRRFRGVHRTVQLNRGVIEEIIGKHAQNQAGIPGMYEDIVELYSHRRANAGAARLSLAHYNDIYLRSQFENGAQGNLYNMEGIRVLMATHNGSAEGIKLGHPVGWVGDYDVMDLGDDPEQYRFSTTLRNNRARNDHGPYIAMAKAFSLSGTALEQAVEQVIDVDQWMRYYALLTLFEIGDTYTLGNPHNIGFYSRPSDGRLLALPYDWDFFFANGDTSPLWGNQNLSRIIARPIFTRRLHGHLLDLIEGTFTPEYLTPFIVNFGQVAGQSYSGYIARIRGRGQYVRSRLPAMVPFEITSNGGADFPVTTPDVTLEGRGWVDVHRVRLAGEGDAPVTWLDGSRWRLTVLLGAATNQLVLEAFNRRGEKVGEDSIRVSTSRVEDSQRRFLRLSEILYHPSDITAAEGEAGWERNDFEFVEIANYGPAPVALAGVRIDGGIEFAVDAEDPRRLAAGGRIVVVKAREAFARRYGTDVPIAGEFAGNLNNAGERIRLLDARGWVIHDVAYGDAPPWPVEADGDGYSLELSNPDGPIGLAEAWRIGALGGSPGRDFGMQERPVLVALRAEAGWVRLRWIATPGLTYRLQGRDALDDRPWLDLGEPVRPDTSGEAEWMEPIEGIARYYRVVVVEE